MCIRDSYGAGVLLERLEAAGADILTKVQPPVAPGGRFPKDRFTIDLGAGTATCPPASPFPSELPRPVVVPLPSPAPAPVARWLPSARPRRPGAPSASAPMRAS